MDSGSQCGSSNTILARHPTPTRGPSSIAIHVMGRIKGTPRRFPWEGHPILPHAKPPNAPKNKGWRAPRGSTWDLIFEFWCPVDYDTFAALLGFPRLATQRRSPWWNGQPCTHPGNTAFEEAFYRWETLVAVRQFSCPLSASFEDVWLRVPPDLDHSIRNTHHEALDLQGATQYPPMPVPQEVTDRERSLAFRQCRNFVSMRKVDDTHIHAVCLHAVLHHPIIDLTEDTAPDSSDSEQYVDPYLANEVSTVLSVHVNPRSPLFRGPANTHFDGPNGDTFEPIAWCFVVRPQLFKHDDRRIRMSVRFGDDPSMRPELHRPVVRVCPARGPHQREPQYVPFQQTHGYPYISSDPPPGEYICFGDYFVDGGYVFSRQISGRGGWLERGERPGVYRPVWNIGPQYVQPPRVLCYARNQENRRFSGIVPSRHNNLIAKQKAQAYVRVHPYLVVPYLRRIAGRELLTVKYVELAHGFLGAARPITCPPPLVPGVTKLKRETVYF
jgi:hypothetical protein